MPINNISVRQREIALIEPCQVSREINDLPRHQMHHLTFALDEAFRAKYVPVLAAGAIIHAERPWAMSTLRYLLLG